MSGGGKDGGNKMINVIRVEDWIGIYIDGKWQDQRITPEQLLDLLKIEYKSEYLDDWDINMSALHCDKCGRFISPENCLEGWTGGLFGDYNGRFYCDTGTGCNKDLKEHRDLGELIGHLLQRVRG